MPHGVTRKKTLLFFLMLSNAKLSAVLHRKLVISELVFVMGIMDVFCEVEAEFLEVICEVSRTPYSETMLDNPSVRM